MKSAASKRILFKMVAVMVGSLPVCLPAPACLSGREQACLEYSWFQTGTGWLAAGLEDIIPQNITDNAFLNLLWNGGVEYSVDLAQQTINNKAGVQIDTCCVPDDPFPFPVSQVPLLHCP
jgi:hypothetical protein